MLTALLILILALMIYLATKSFAQPGIVLGMMWAMFAVEQIFQQSSPFLRANSSFFNIALTLFASLVVLVALQKGSLDLRGIPIEYYYVVCLYTLAFFSLAWCPNYRFTLEQIEKYAPYIVAFVVIAPLCGTRPQQIKQALDCTLILGAFVLVAATLAKVGSRGIVLTRTAGGESIEANPLAMADFAGLVTICAMFSLYSSKHNQLKRLAIISIALLGLYVIIRGGSRGQLIAVVVSCFIWLPITARIAMQKSTLLAGMMVAGAIAFGVWAIEYFELSLRWQRVSLVEASGGRVNMIMALLSAWSESGVFGLVFGLGNSAAFSVAGFYPHNLPAEVLGEEGILGLALLSLFAFSILSRGWYMLKMKTIDQEMRLASGLLLAVFTFSLLASLKQGNLLGSTPVFSFGLSVAWVQSWITRRAPAQHQAAKGIRRAAVLR